MHSNFGLQDNDESEINTFIKHFEKHNFSLEINYASLKKLKRYKINFIFYMILLKNNT